eukprot:10744493-Ditylum_brightwellii.AAC.1
MEELHILQHPTTWGHMTAALPPMLDKFNKVCVRRSTRKDQASSAEHNQSYVNKSTLPMAIS